MSVTAWMIKAGALLKNFLPVRVNSYRGLHKEKKSAMSVTACKLETEAILNNFLLVRVNSYRR